MFVCLRVCCFYFCVHYQIYYLYPIVFDFVFCMRFTWTHDGLTWMYVVCVCICFELRVKNRAEQISFGFSVDSPFLCACFRWLTHSITQQKWALHRQHIAYAFFMDKNVFYICIQYPMREYKIQHNKYPLWLTCQFSHFLECGIFVE